MTTDVQRRALHANASREFLHALAMEGTITPAIATQAHEWAMDPDRMNNRRLQSPQAALQELKILTEDKLMQSYIEDSQIPLVELTHFDIPEDIRKKLDLQACWGTWTVPFDFEEGYHFVATAYPKTKFVRKIWEDFLKGPIIWHVAPNDQIAEILERVENERSAEVRKSA